MTTRLVVSAAILGVVMFFPGSDTHAGASVVDPGDLEVGAIIGEPTGLSLKY